MNYQTKLTEYLLQIKAIKLDITNPFTWASGWKSPIYCDNRKTLSYPVIRTYIRDAFVEIIRDKFPRTEGIAGVATGAIGIGTLVADVLNLPFVYVRSKPKDHGLANMIEGEVVPNQKMVVVEDLVSTGKSSLNAVKALRETGINVLGMTAIFTYDFQVAKDRFLEEDVLLYTLTDYSHLIDIAVHTGYVLPEHLDSLKEWRLNPEQWKK
ncbi:MAG: orotate phosphoribosyltransferase [Chlorobi bacterium]|nr:orotate phosphoribosyltransferase [Chlorobiota bacterium]